VTARARKRLDESGLAQGYGAEETSAIAKKVGVAALKFADLSNPRVSDYIFDLDRFIAFEGKTGPYLLYASVRVRSVLAKAEEKGAGSPGRVAIECKEERELALRLLAFADALRETYDKRMPHILCEHVFQLAQSFSKLYGARRIADEAAPRKRASRLALAGAAGRQIDLILDLLGVETPQRM
jgi:arginyl-tRNA synthetase